MTLARSAAITLTTMESRVRDEIGDPALDFEGNTIPAGSRRYSDAQVDTAINDMLMEMYTFIHRRDPGHDLVTSAAVTYSGGGNSSLNLTDNIADIAAGAEVYMVMDETTSAVNRRLDYVSPVELESFNSRLGTETRVATRKYTLEAQSDGDIILKIRPNPLQGLSVRVKYVLTPLIWQTSSKNDVHSMTARWRELMTLGAAKKLMRRDDEIPLQSQQEYDRLWMQFMLYAKRVKSGDRKIQIRRRAI
jgi:hypothetical protein